MDNSKLTMRYREADLDCALLHYRLQSHAPYEKDLFLPTPEALDEVWKEWKRLKVQVTELEAPDKVFALVKNHLEDFLDLSLIHI